MGMFFMFFCDNNLNVINTLPKDLQKRIERLEHLRASIKSKEDFERFRNLLHKIIIEICATKRTHDKELLAFVGGLTMIEKNMFWEDTKDADTPHSRYTDINDNGVLI